MGEERRNGAPMGVGVHIHVDLVVLNFTVHVGSGTQLFVWCPPNGPNKNIFNVAKEDGIGNGMKV